MKSLLSILFIPFSLLLISCGGDDDGNGPSVHCSGYPDVVTINGSSNNRTEGGTYTHRINNTANFGEYIVNIPAINGDCNFTSDLEIVLLYEASDSLTIDGSYPIYATSGIEYNKVKVKYYIKDADGTPISDVTLTEGLLAIETTGSNRYSISLNGTDSEGTALTYTTTTSLIEE